MRTALSLATFVAIFHQGKSRNKVQTVESGRWHSLSITTSQDFEAQIGEREEKQRKTRADPVKFPVRWQLSRLVSKDFSWLYFLRKRSNSWRFTCVGLSSA